MSRQQLLNGALARQLLLHELAHDRHHRKPAVLQLLELEGSKVISVVGDESSAEPDITRGAVGGVLLADGQLDGAKGQEDLPEGHGALVEHLGEGGQGAGVGEDLVGQVVEGLDEGAQAGQHGDSAVLELDQTGAVQGGLVLGQAQRVKHTAGLHIRANHLVHGHAHAAAAGHAGGSGHEGRGHAEEGEEGKSSLHLRGGGEI